MGVNWSSQITMTPNELNEPNELKESIPENAVLTPTFPMVDLLEYKETKEVEMPAQPKSEFSLPIEINIEFMKENPAEMEFTEDKVFEPEPVFAKASTQSQTNGTQTPRKTSTCMTCGQATTPTMDLQEQLKLMQQKIHENSLNIKDMIETQVNLFQLSLQSFKCASTSMVLQNLDSVLKRRKQQVIRRSKFSRRFNKDKPLGVVKSEPRTFRKPLNKYKCVYLS